MGSSHLRRRRRLQLAVNRKSTVSWWIGCATVRVVIRVAPTRRQEKGPKGPSVRRRLRGQRKGRVRSRVRHTRSSAHFPPLKVTPPPDSYVSRRALRIGGRPLIWAQMAASRFHKSCGRSFARARYDREVYVDLRRRWLALSSRVPLSVRRVVFEPSFERFLAIWGPPTSDDLDDLLALGRRALEPNRYLVNAPVSHRLVYDGNPAVSQPSNPCGWCISEQFERCSLIQRCARNPGLLRRAAVRGAGMKAPKRR